ncbi:MAG: hypothetical protein FWE91_10150 [Defluviitaleaceae bacterium]|nr:hypothetical protein [Defluviitaleaceae bacterium]
MIKSENAVSHDDNIKKASVQPKFDEIISILPEEFRNEIIETDGFLKSLRPLKFKRTIDKFGNKITYVASDFGVSYAFRVTRDQFSHELNWYIVYNGKPETWHRKADYMEEMLDEIEKSNPRLAERIFSSLIKCVNCHGEKCLAKTIYTFRDRKKLTCHGRVVFRICHDDFNGAREFFRHLNAYVERKAANGDPPTEKIILINTNRSL